MRTILILVLTAIALALMRLLVSDVSKAVSRAWGSRKGSQPDAGPQSAQKMGRLAKDPQTGAYVDEDAALRETIDGHTYFFESEQSRDAYVKKQGAAKT